MLCVCAHPEYDCVTHISTFRSCLLSLCCLHGQSNKVDKSPFFKHSSLENQVGRFWKQIIHVPSASWDERWQRKWDELSSASSPYVSLRDTKGCREAAEPLQSRLSFWHQRAPGYSAIVVCLFVKFKRTVSFFKLDTSLLSLTGLVFWFIQHEGEFWLLQMSRTGQETWVLFSRLFVSAVNKPLLIYDTGPCLSPNKHTPAAVVIPCNISVDDPTPTVCPLRPIHVFVSDFFPKISW